MRAILFVLGFLALIAPPGSHAQTPDGDASRHAVAYVAVRPAAVAAAAAAFRQYRESSRREPGFRALDLLEQIERPGHFVILETWTDQAAFDAHQSATSSTQFRAAFQALQVGGYDQRPYRTLTATPGASAGRGALRVVSHVDIAGGSSFDAPAFLRRVAEAARAEPGCVRFDVLQHTVRPNHFTVVEVWENQRALDAHAALPSTRRYREELVPVTGSPVDERLFKSVE